MVLRCLRLHMEYRFPNEHTLAEVLGDLLYRGDMASLVEMAMSENEDRAREEIRRELGEEVEGVATVHSTTLREAQGVDDEEPVGG